MGFLIGAIFELLWILIKGFFDLGYAMCSEFANWLIELGKEYPIVSIPLVIVIVISVTKSIVDSIRMIIRSHNRNVEKSMKRLQEKRERGDMM